MAEPPNKKARMDLLMDNQQDKNERCEEQYNSSQDMFADSTEEESDEDNDWSGVAISNIPRLSSSAKLPSQYPAPHPGPTHSVCVQLPVLERVPKPHPNSLKDVWDSFHVRLPWSRENLYPVEDKNEGKKVLRSRWELIIESLTRQKMSSSFDLEEAILSYNTRYRGKPDWDFAALHTLFTEEFEPEETQAFFDHTLPGMVDILVSSPNILTCPLPLLCAGSAHSITISQYQVLVILVNAFFCTFPRRNAKAGGSEFSSYPSINFNTLYGPCCRRPEAHLEKLKCLLSYFSRVVTNTPTGLITFSRKVVPARGVPNWANSTTTIPMLHITSKGAIEVEGTGMLQADFANKFVGGGVLRSGLVQEEIRFTVCPELLASMLFTEVLGDREVLVIVGVEQFTSYEGYSDTFKFAGRFTDMVEVDSSGRKMTSVVAMDAIRFNNSYDQFMMRNIDRELNKAFVAFQNRHVDSLQAVATGNWGCGAFGGDPRVKLLLQLMAAAEAGRDVVYFTFGDSSLVRDGGEMYKFLVKEKLTVGDLYKLIKRFSSNRRQLGGEELFSWIYHAGSSSGKELNIDAYEVDTDSEKEDVHDTVMEKVILGQESTANAKNPSDVLSEVTDSDKWLNEQMDNMERKVDADKNCSTQTKNGGFFAALDRMEKGELETKNVVDGGTCPIEVSLGLGHTANDGLGPIDEIKLDNSKHDITSKKRNQSKVTDFFQTK